MNVTKQRTSMYAALVALASCLILLAGWLARPRDIPQSPPPLPSESELAQLARQAERRSLRNITEYFAATASDVASSIVHIRGAQTSGVVWHDGRIVAAPVQRGHASLSLIVMGAPDERSARSILWEPGLPLMLLDGSRGLAGLSPVRRATALPRPGDWVVAVWRTDRERAFVPGYFGASAAAACGPIPIREAITNIPLSRTMAGGGLFNLDGGLFAMILPCGERLAAVTADSIQSVLQSGNPLERRVMARYGIVIAPISDPEKTYFKHQDGVIVREVLTGYRGDNAGLIPGDIITGLDGTVVIGPQDLRHLVEPSGKPSFELTVGRGSKVVQIRLPAADVEVSGEAHTRGAPG